MHLFKAPIPFYNIHNIILKITNIVQPYCPLSSHFKIKLIQPNFRRQILPSPSCGWKKKYDCLILSREHLGIWYQNTSLEVFRQKYFYWSHFPVRHSHLYFHTIYTTMYFTYFHLTWGVSWRNFECYITTVPAIQKKVFCNLYRQQAYVQSAIFFIWA